MEEVLQDLGLTVLEIKIYKFLLLEGPNQAGSISRKTGIHRRNVYDALERLIQKGLVGYIKENNKRQYSAENPSVVLERLDDKRKQWERAIPQIHAQMKSWGETKETLFFRGQEGIKHVFLDQISEGKEILVFATSKDVESVVKFFLPKYEQMRKEKRIPIRMIFDSSAKKSVLPTLKKLPLCRFKFVDKFNASSMSQYVYGNNTSIIVWDESPTSILIRREEIAKGYRERFEIMWKIGK